MSKKKTLIVAVSGKMRHGKDTVGQYLITKYKFNRIGFADKLKEICINYDNSTPALRKQWNEKVAKELFPNIKNGAAKVDALAQKVQPGVWRKPTHEECFGSKPEWVRLLLQRFAQGCREINPDCWVNCALNKCIEDGGRWVITDVRYRNEAFAVEVLENSQIWRVHKDDVEASVGSDHISETDLDTFPFEVIIDNNGTIEGLYKKIDKLMKAFLRGNRPFMSGGEVY